MSRKDCPKSGNAIVYSHTNTSDNIIEHNLRTSTNERIHFFIKIYLSHFILERMDVSVLCERWVEWHILREDFLFPYLLPGARGLPTLAPPCKLVIDAPGRLRVSHSTVILCTLSKYDHVVLVTWSPSSYTPVVPKCPDLTDLLSNHNVTACQSTRGH